MLLQAETNLSQHFRIALPCASISYCSLFSALTLRFICSRCISRSAINQALFYVLQICGLPQPHPCACQTHQHYRWQRTVQQDAQHQYCVSNRGTRRVGVVMPPPPPAPALPGRLPPPPPPGWRAPPQSRRCPAAAHAPAPAPGTRPGSGSLGDVDGRQRGTAVGEGCFSASPASKSAVPAQQ